MPLKNRIAIFLGKLILNFSQSLNLGYGGTWPGEIALRINPQFLARLSSSVKKGILIIAGTNGKTTTALMIRSILQAKGYKVTHNESGANLINGLVSAIIANSSPLGSFACDYAVFEVDENTLPQILKFVTPKIVICLNLFRDQLDRYGEVDTIAEKWQKALKDLPQNSTVILNSDDPQIAYLGIELLAKTIYFGVNDPKSYLNQLEHATDSIFCLSCHHRLDFSGIYYSHIGIWQCNFCQFSRPQPLFSKWLTTLPGIYNRYNSLAAQACAKSLNIEDKIIKEKLSQFSPAFGRQEEFKIDKKRVKIFLSKNPAGFNQSLKTVISLGAETLLICLNDRIPDGRDVSWIWDVDFEMITSAKLITVSGDRVHDLSLRLHYANINHLTIEENLETAINKALEQTRQGEILYILPTYSAMLDIRKILTGKKIL